MYKEDKKPWGAYEVSPLVKVHNISVFCDFACALLTRLKWVGLT